MLGVETAFAIANTELDADIEKLVELLSINRPHRRYRRSPRRPDRGRSAANLALLDLDEQWTITGAALASRARTPLRRAFVRGTIRHTIWNGDLVVTNGEATR